VRQSKRDHRIEGWSISYRGWCVREIREFVKQVRLALAREQSVELGKLANNQFKSGKEAKAIVGRVAGLRRAESIMVDLLNNRQDREDGDLPTMED
jgi:hypothetical protein